MKEKTRKDAVIERVADMAMQPGGKHPADLGAVRSRRDFTQRQLMACRILRAHRKTTYHGMLEFLSVSPSPCKRPGLEEKLSHYNTRQKFSAP